MIPSLTLGSTLYHDGVLYVVDGQTIEGKKLKIIAKPAELAQEITNILAAEGMIICSL